MMVPKFAFLLGFLLSAFTSVVFAERILEAHSLSTCMENSMFSATYFTFTFTPDNSSLTFGILGVSDISASVVLDFKVYAYGFLAVSKIVNPDTNSDLAGLNPMSPGRIDLHSNTAFPSDLSSSIPAVAYTVPDLDGIVQIYLNDSATGEPLACVQAQLTNGKTVYQKAVGWTTAVIAGLGLATSAIASGLGHSNTAAHLAANAMSLFGLFQAQAFVGMASVPLPPIVSAWTQNFQWSLGIIRVGFLQRMATWYQRATGGTPSELLYQLSTTSVIVERKIKRSVEFVVDVGQHLLRRDSSTSDVAATSPQTVTVHGITRVGFNANIERTNIFLTGYSFFIIFIILVIIGVVAFKYICEGLSKAGHMKTQKFQEFRNGWTTVLKGIMFRIVLIGFPQMALLCFWQLIERDSAGEIVLAIITVATMIGLLCWAISKVWRIAQQSKVLHSSAAYTLYSDPAAVNKWGFLYVQFRAETYYFVACTLIYILVKAMFIAFSQGSGKVLGVALFVIEGAYLILVSVMRPYMDKKTNIFNISIAAVNFLNAIFLLVFSNIFGEPATVSSVMGVVFFFYNVIFAFILLILVLASSLAGVFSKNPDTRYRPMRDDRDSFMKHQTGENPSTELSALGITARGDEPKPIDDGYEDDIPSSHSNHSNNRSNHERDVSFSMNTTGPGGYPQQVQRSPSFQTGVGYAN